MGRVFFLGKLFLLFIFIAALFLLVARAQLIRKLIGQQLGMSRTAVAGAKTSMESEMKDNVNEYAKHAKDSAMKINVSDIINAVLRVKKIGVDAVKAKDSVQQQINKLLEKR